MDGNCAGTMILGLALLLATPMIKRLARLTLALLSDTSSFILILRPTQSPQQTALLRGFKKPTLSTRASLMLCFRWPRCTCPLGQLSTQWTMMGALTRFTRSWNRLRLGRNPTSKLIGISLISAVPHQAITLPVMHS